MKTMKESARNSGNSLEACLREMGLTVETLRVVTDEGGEIPLRVLCPGERVNGWLERALQLAKDEPHGLSVLPRAAVLIRLWFGAADPRRRGSSTASHAAIGPTVSSADTQLARMSSTAWPIYRGDPGNRSRTRSV
jgi:hypothetical protein